MNNHHSNIINDDAIPSFKGGNLGNGRMNNAFNKFIGDIDAEEI